MTPTDQGDRSLLTSAAIALAASGLGLVGLPLMVGHLPGAFEARVWLGAASVVCVCLIVPTRPLAYAVATLLARVPGRGGAQAASTHTLFDLARLITATAYLVLVQSILRQPLVAVLGPSVEPFAIEAVFAVVALLLLLVLLSWIHRAARPLLENLAWLALDSTLATSGSETPAPALATQHAAATVAAHQGAATVDNETLTR